MADKIDNISNLWKEITQINHINIKQIEEAAKSILPKEVYDFYAGGAMSEFTLHQNESVFNRVKLIPRVLSGMKHVSLASELLGMELPFPIISAPMAFQCLAHPDGEIAVAKAIHKKGLIYTNSTMSTISLEEIAKNSIGQNWFQLYIYKDRDLTYDLVKRAEMASYQGIVLTVDVPIMGKRERDISNKFNLPKHLKAANFSNIFSKKLSRKINQSSIKEFTDDQFDSALSWQDVEWLKSVTTLPIILKGIMRNSDAEKAVKYGVDAIIVSNHGGRQLDGVASSVELLSDIVKVVNDRIPILLDGGIRRGTDIMKVLALGADGVLIGRPLIWGLAISGEEGVALTLSILCQEFYEAMILCGYESIYQLKQDRALISFDR